MLTELNIRYLCDNLKPLTWKFIHVLSRSNCHALPNTNVPHRLTQLPILLMKQAPILYQGFRKMFKSQLAFISKFAKSLFKFTKYSLYINDEFVGNWKEIEELILLG